MKTQRILLLIILVIFVAANNLIGQKERPPSRVTLSLNTNEKGTMIPLKIWFNIGEAFKDGALIFELRDTTDTIIEKTTLWEGKADTSFHEQFARSIKLPIGSKLRILALLSYTTLDGRKYPDGANLFIHRTSRWITTDVSSFYDLELIELIREAKEKGLNVYGLSIDQIKKLDPDLAKKFDKHYGSGTDAPGSTPHQKYAPIFSPTVVKPKTPVIDSIKNVEPLKSDTTKRNQPQSEVHDEKLYPVVKEIKP